MTRKLCLIGVVVALGVVMPVLAGDDERPAESQLEIEEARARGALLFQIHCASCHGLDARGGGPLAEHMRVLPGNLRELLRPDEAGEFVFPEERLRHLIDGRESVGGHGSKEMPVWGVTFQDAGRAENQEEGVREKIGDLLQYLQTLQAFDSDESSDTKGTD